MKDTDNVVISYSRDVENWLNNTITFSDSSVGDAKLVITDHFYCEPTVIILKQATTVAKIGDKEYTSLQDALNAAQDGQTVTLVADVKASKYLDIYTPNNGETERSITLDLNGKTITWSDNYKYAYYPLVFVGINQTLTIKNGSIIADEHVAVGAYGHVNLENVTVESKTLSNGETAVCIWNWSEDDTYFEDCKFLITGSATITGGKITGGILAEGTVELAANAGFDKLYLNTKTGYGKAVVPTGYGMVKTSGYYTNLHKHDQNNAGACSICGFAASYVKTDLAYIKSTDIVVITMSKDGTTWALSSANGTAKTAPAVTVTVKDNKITDSNISSELLWNINNTNDTLVIYINGDDTKYLYCINDTTGVRAGQTTDSFNNKDFIIKDDYLYNVAQGRYVGVFDSKDWRSYTTLHDNIKGETLVFYVLKTNCDHKNTEPRAAIAATCTHAGHAAGTYCLDCDTYTSGGAMIVATGHTFGEMTIAKEPTCTEKGKGTYRCTVCNKLKTESIPTVAHNYVDGVCTACDALAPKAVTYVFANYPAGEQYKENEEHVLDSKVTVVTTQCHFTSELRIYSSSAHNGNAIIKSTDAISGLALNAGDNKDTLNVYGSNDGGTTWILISTVSVNGAYADYSVDFGGNTYKWLKLDAASEQIRVKYMALTTVSTGDAEGGETVCEHTNTTTTTVDATCTVAGATTVICDDCGETISTTVISATGHTEETVTGKAATCTAIGLTDGKKCSVCGVTTVAQSEIDALGHNYVDGVCSKCNEKDPEAGGTTEPVYGWVKVTDASTLKAGDQIILCSGSTTNGTFVAGNISKNIMASLSITIKDDNNIKTLPDDAVVLELGGSSDSWTFTNSNGKMLGATAVKKLAWGSGTTKWTISIDKDGKVTIQNTTSSYGRILYNVNDPRFTTYTSNTSSSMVLPEIYRYEVIG